MHTVFWMYGKNHSVDLDVDGTIILQ